MCSLGAMSASDSQFQRNVTSDGIVWSVYKTFAIDFIPDSWIPVISLIPNFEYHPWLFSMIGSAIIGLSGVFPLLVIPIEEGANLKSGGKLQHPLLYFESADLCRRCGWLPRCTCSATLFVFRKSEVFISVDSTEMLVISIEFHTTGVLKVSQIFACVK
jgi:hypothetical protein